MAGNAFSFNFQLSLDGDAQPASSDAVATPTLSVQQAPSKRKIERVSDFVFMEGVSEMMKEKQLQQLHSDPILTLSDGSSLRKVSTRGVHSNETLYNELEKQRTDIIPGTYEGGLKVWECSLDLCRYLSDHRDTFKPKFAMELGCGHGLPLCFVLRNGLQTGTKALFADFNDFVLKDVTMANILLNTEGHSADEIANSIVLGAGDWLAMSTQLQADNRPANDALPADGRFDLVLAAETTYTEEAANETAMLLSRHLGKGGVGLVATKRYYFGCGGGSDTFRTAAAACQVSIEGCSYGLSVETAEVFDDGSGNIRELLKVMLQQSVLT